MNVETQHAETPKLQGDALQSLLVQSPSISISNHNRSDYDDNVINAAYDEIRRSVSPRVAEYIFRPRENRSSSTENNFAEGGWTFERILTINEHELMQLSQENCETLADLEINLWNFGKRKHMHYCAHIHALLYARVRLFGMTNTKILDTWTRNQAINYLRMDRTTECETLLIGVIAAIDLHRPGDTAGDDFRSLLGRLRLQQGQHTLAEQLCRQAMLRLISALGLAHSMTWRAYCRLRLVLEAQGRFDEMQRLATDFYSDAHRTVSAQVLPGLNALLELCRSYIEKWIAESNLQRLVRNCIMDDIPLGVGEKSTIILSAIARERYREERSQGIPQVIKDLQGIMDVPVLDLLSITSLLIASRIQAGQHLESISLRQEALRIVQDLKSTKFLFPLWIFISLHQGNWWQNPSRKGAEYNIIQSLEDGVIGRSHPTESACFRSSADGDSSVSVLGIAESPKIGQSDLLNGSWSGFFCGNFH
jgi:hypothetical protein